MDYILLGLVLTFIVGFGCFMGGFWRGSDGLIATGVVLIIVVVIVFVVYLVIISLFPATTNLELSHYVIAFHFILN